MVIKRGYPFIKEIYSKYSGRYALPSQPKYMSLEEFYQCIQDSGVVNENFNDREIKPIYSISMMTQKDEIESDRL